jgi:hypothetical protein
MKPAPAAWLASASLTAALAWGCGKPPSPPSDTKPSKVNRPSETIDVDSLPAVDGAVPPLDDGRLRLSLPGDWYRLPRSKQFLVAAQLSRQAKYPSISIHVEPTTGADDMSPDDWTADDLKIRAAEVQMELDQEQAKLAEPARPIRIGPFVGVQYAKGAKVDKLPLERLFLVTVAGGRRYTLELRAVHGELHKFRPLAQAVAASMQFGR